MTTSIFFLSNGYKGGANNYIYQNLNYISKKCNSVLIDKAFDNQLLDHSKNIKLIKLNLFENIFSNYKNLKKIFLNNKKERNIIFLTNFAIYLLYFFLFLTIRKFNFKVVLTLHSGIFINNLKNNFISICFSLIANNIDNIIYGSESSKDWWMQRYFWMRWANYKVIYNGINLKKFKKKRKIKLKKLNISFVGRVAKENNPELFLKIVKDNLKNKFIKFHCFGEGPLKKELIHKNIKHHGWCDSKTIYNKTDLIIIT